jgi:hypothetical protein
MARTLSLVLFATCQFSAVSAASSQWEWTDVPRVVVIGDVHGSYDKMLTLLEGTGLVDEGLGWIGGEDHLVFVGDLVDRGPDDRPVLDLVRSLQSEAEAAGGRVHPLLGNHEVMNMSGDFRYVSEKGFRDFLPQEDKKARNRAMQRFRNTYGPGIPLQQIKPAFEERFPPGYFGRLAAFWHDGEYGSWLLQQPALVMINGVVFLHGGLTEEVAALGLDAINRQVHQDILRFMNNAETLVDVTGVPPSYVDAILAAREAGQRARDTSKQAVAARTILQLSDALPYVPAGPLWYRGISLENERLERFNVERSLSSLGARAMVVAHTPTKSGVINSRFNGQVYRVDVGMAYGRKPQALVFSGDEAKVYDPATQGYTAPMPEPARGEGWSRFSEQLPEAQMLEFLSTAKVTGCEMFQRGVRHAEVCDLEGRDLHMRAVFLTIDEKPGTVEEEPKSVARSWRNEIAAYRLDRYLELDLVPVTIERTIEGRTGSLQIWLESAVDLTLLQTYDQMHLLQGLERPILVARAFSAWMDVYGRHDAGKMLLPQDRRIALADSTKAFSTAHQLNPEAIPDPCPSIPPARELFLRSITAEKIQQVVGPYLNAEQIDALIVRRDQLLDICTSTVAATEPAG